MRTKSYNDIEKQVNRMLNFMLDSLGYGYSDPCSEEYNFVASSRLEYIRRTQHSYISNINKSEGLYPDMYCVHKSESKQYQRKVYAAY